MHFKNLFILPEIYLYNIKKNLQLKVVEDSYNMMNENQKDNK